MSLVGMLAAPRVIPCRQSVLDALHKAQQTVYDRIARHEFKTFYLVLVILAAKKPRGPRTFVVQIADVHGSRDERAEGFKEIGRAYYKNGTIPFCTALASEGWACEKGSPWAPEDSPNRQEAMLSVACHMGLGTYHFAAMDLRRDDEGFALPGEFQPVQVVDTCLPLASFYAGYYEYDCFFSAKTAKDRVN
jgi:hypothetical protein